MKPQELQLPRPLCQAYDMDEVKACLWGLICCAERNVPTDMP